MAEERRAPEALVDALLSRRRLAPGMFEPRLDLPSFETVEPGPFTPQPQPQPPAPPVQPPQPSPPPPAPPMAAPPQAPPESPFAELPYPSPGDRIKAEDFRRLSQALQVVFDAYALAGATFGFPFGQVRLALAAQQYEVARVLSASGTEIADPAGGALDDRRVLHVAPVVLGDRRVTVVLSEVAETRRYMPDLRGLTYRQAAERIQAELGDLTVGGAPMLTPQLEGLTLTDAARRVTG